MKVFYSWQLDAPRLINKDFIYGALTDAIGELEEDLDLAQADREPIILDQDTQGVLGSPEVARIIFEKIAVAQVVVADVSLVAKGADEKPHINSNVAIELGYTYGKVGDDAVLKIMNTYFGQPSELPFDLRTRRYPIQYYFSPDMEKSRVVAEKKKLTGQLRVILKLYIERSAATEKEVAHVPSPFVNLRGQYWKSGEILIPRREMINRNAFIWSGQSILYFRCIPENQLSEISARDAYEHSADLWPLNSEGGFSRTRNKWGVISHCLDHDGNNLIGATQLFRNREIWGIDTYYPEVMTDTNDDKEEPKRFIPTGAVQRDYPRAIDSMRNLVLRLGYGNRYRVEMGFSGAEGAYLAIKRRSFGQFVGPFYDTEVFITKLVTAEFPTGEILNDFWDKLFSELGHQVPEDLVWKPSG